MQSDEEIGKVAKAVPVIISKTLELFVETLLAKTLKITNSRNAKTLSPSHMKQCIMSEKKFDFLRDLVKNIPDISVAEEAANYHEEDAAQSSPDDYPDSDTPYDLSMPSTSTGKTLPRSETQLNGSSGSNFHIKINISGSGCNNMELKRSLSQNGYISNNRAAGQLKRESDIVQRLQQRIESIANDNNAASSSSSSSSVIKHTTSIAAVNSDFLPNKLARSESTPAPTAAIGSTNNISNRSPLKESMLTAATTMQNSTPTKLQQQNAIPAPIVSFDFCNKPVVKIDYSNLPLTTSTGNAEMISATPIAPLSAPAHVDTIHQTKTAFDFNATTPVINIDLSKIVPPLTCNATADGKTPSTATPAIATISIGNLSAAATTAETKIINSKVSELISTSISSTIAAGVPCNVNKTTSSTSLELDEDYDNI